MGNENVAWKILFIGVIIVYLQNERIWANVFFLNINTMRKLCVFLFSWLMLLQGTSADMKEKEADVCIYGATSAGVIAAYTAKIQGKSVLLIEPTARIGGLSAGGLGDTDIGKVDIIQV